MRKNILRKAAFLNTTSLYKNTGRLAVVIAGLMVTATPTRADDAGISVALPDPSSFEVPVMDAVISGAATFDYSTPGNLTINQSTQNTVIDYSTFNLGENAVTEFVQPHTNALAVNRVKDANPSRINGHLRANGQIVILNQNGVFFGPKSQVDVAGLVASTGALDTDEFTRNDTVRLTDIGTTGTIQNDGQINIHNAGIAAFVAPHVVNNGVIEAQMGKIALASGTDVATVDLYGDGLVSLALDAATSHALIENSGTIRANGGKIAITAQAAADAVDNLVNLGGVVEAQSVSRENGVIRLGGNAKVKVSGTITTSGRTNGGTIDIQGRSIETTGSALVMADAYDNGKGGTIRFFAGENAFYQGGFYARGGLNGGNGGSVELSALNSVGYNGSVNTTAPNGTAGSFLIDPISATIHSGILHLPLGPNYVLSAQALANDIDQNGSVTVQADDHIDVGTDVVFPGIGTSNIDLAHYDYTTLEITGFTQIGPFTFPIFSLVSHSGITAGDVTLNTNVINFNKDVLLGTGGMNVLANTVNLNSKLSGTDGLSTWLLGQADILNTTAGTVNVLSPNALIQQGLYLADGGAMVNVAAGTYLESLHVNKAVTLNGANVGVAGNGVRSAETIIDPNSPGILVNANNVTVDGFFITGADDGILVDGANTTWLKNNLITGNTRDGINVKNSKNTTIDHNAIDHNGRDGIELFNSQFTNIHHNLIDFSRIDGVFSTSNQFLTLANNTITNSRDDGIDVEGTLGTVSITNNVVDVTGVGFVLGTNESNGIELSGAKNAVISDNTITHALWDGIYIDQSTGTQIVNNTVNGVTGNHGINVGRKSVDTTVSKNTISTIGRYGINVFDATTTHILGNTISLTKLDGIHSSSNRYLWVDGNTLTDIREDGIDVEGTLGTVEITNNTIHNAGFTLPLGSDQANGIELSGAKNALISGNRVYNSQWNGIYVDQSDGTLIAGNLTDGTIGSHGIDINLLSKNTTVRDNTITNARRYGVNVFNSSDTHVLNNLISLTKLDGIHSSSSKNIWVDGNTLTTIREDGIDVEGTSGVIEITRNIVNGAGVGLSGDQGNGIELSNGLNAQILGNTINGAQYSGIWIDLSKGTTVANNVVTGAQLAGLSMMGNLNDAGGLTITTLRDNSFTSLLDGAIFQSGNVAFNGINTFNFTHDGLVFTPSLSKPAPFLAVVGDTFGTTVLNDANTLGYFINIKDGALFNPGTPTILDARFVTFNDGTDFINYVPGSFVLPFATWTALENRLHDFDDTGVDGQIFFEPDSIPTFSILGADINDILNPIQPAEFQQGGGSVTILGLPFARILPGGAAGNTPDFLAQIAPAAGGDENPENLANIEPAAGGANSNQAGCWDQVYNNFNTTNNPVTFNISGSPLGLIGSQSNCLQATGL